MGWRQTTGSVEVYGSMWSVPLAAAIQRWTTGEASLALHKRKQASALREKAGAGSPLNCGMQRLARNGEGEARLAQEKAAARRRTPY